MKKMIKLIIILYFSINKIKTINWGDIKELSVNTSIVVSTLAIYGGVLYVGTILLSNVYYKYRINNLISKYTNDLHINFDNKNNFFMSSDCNNLEELIFKSFSFPYDSFNKNHILIFGNPGTGKTYGIKNIVQKNGYELFSIPRDFFEKNINIETYNVSRNLIEKKLIEEIEEKIKQEKKIIIFIDEIDIIAISRKTNFKEERESFSSFMKFLEEMSKKKVLVIGATNEIKENFDSALLRDQRFGNQIYFKNNFTNEEKKELISFFLKKVKCPESKKSEIEKLCFDSIKDNSVTVAKIEKTILDFIYEYNKSNLEEEQKE